MDNANYEVGSTTNMGYIRAITNMVDFGVSI
jgi:hypothetical protein